MDDCTTESDCDSGEACATLTNSQWSGDGDGYSLTKCVDHDGWCAQNSAAADATPNYSDGGQFDPVNASAWEYWTVSGCDGDDYTGWLWTEQDFYIQDYWNEGDCADYAETEKECTTVSWNGSAVEAWCGTATWGDYSNIACYPLDDCATLGGPVPNPVTGDANETDTYSLLCGSMKLVASAAAAIAMAASI